jgi:hypothetical protein
MSLNAGPMTSDATLRNFLHRTISITTSHDSPTSVVHSCLGICGMSSISQELPSASPVNVEEDLRASPAAPSSPPEFTPGMMEPEVEVPEAEKADDGCKPVQDFGPKEKIEDFHWQDLEDRYESKMDECDKVEEELFKEFASLMAVIQLGHLTFNIGF